jgi:hypothetical protein
VAFGRNKPLRQDHDKSQIAHGHSSNRSSEKKEKPDGPSIVDPSEHEEVATSRYYKLLDIF